ncbi:MAG: hypothetical protein LBC78_01205 [Oscillospiraceae bacterium]|jgi:hypothetical protein|nr:hypothetical protein [Oscillospiraceae bacterium]
MKRLSKAAREHIKTAGIILLSALALFLALKLGVFAQLWAAMRSESGSYVGTSAVPELAEGARPCVIAVTNAEGARLCAAWDFAAADALYDRTAGFMSEALSSVGSFVETTEEAWRNALQEEGIYYEYSQSATLDTIRAWLGARPGESGERSLCRLCLSAAEERLYLQCGESFYSAPIEGVLEGQGISGEYESVSFAFEESRDIASPYVMLVSARFPVYTAKNPLEDEAVLEKILGGLGISMKLIPGYYGVDGERVFVAASKTVTVTRAGDVSVSFCEPYEIFAGTGLSAAECAQTFLAPLIRNAGDARVSLSGVDSQDGGITVTFDYYLSGGRVFLGGNAFTVTFSGGRLVSAELKISSFDAIEERLTLLPALQAAAVSDDAALGYSGGETLRPFWYDRRALT